jgi:hypothetical protein
VISDNIRLARCEFSFCTVHCLEVPDVPEEMKLAFPAAAHDTSAGTFELSLDVKHIHDACG